MKTALRIFEITVKIFIVLISFIFIQEVFQKAFPDKHIVGIIVGVVLAVINYYLVFHSYTVKDIMAKFKRKVSFEDAQEPNPWMQLLAMFGRCVLYFIIVAIIDIILAVIVLVNS